MLFDFDRGRGSQLFTTRKIAPCLVQTSLFHNRVEILAGAVLFRFTISLPIASKRLMIDSMSLQADVSLNMTALGLSLASLLPKACGTAF